MFCQFCKECVSKVCRNSAKARSEESISCFKYTSKGEEEGVTRFGFTRGSRVRRLRVRPASIVAKSEGGDECLLCRLGLDVTHTGRVSVVISFLVRSNMEVLLSSLGTTLRHNIEVRVLANGCLKVARPSTLCLLGGRLNSGMRLHFCDSGKHSFRPGSCVFRCSGVDRVCVNSSGVSEDTLASKVR